MLPTVPVPTRTPTPTPADPLMGALDAISPRMNVLRELYSLRPIDREFISRDELSARLREDFEDDRDDIYETQELYVTLGIIDRDTNLFDLLLKLHEEGVVGFFDSEEEKMYIVKDAPEFSPGDALTYAHEFVHGLQQQHSDIHSIREGLGDNSDRNRAYRALVEGDASLSEQVYMFQHMDEDERAAVQEGASGASFEAFLSAPRVIQRTFTFPYAQGPQFVLSLYRTANAWAPVNQAFEDLPQSTEQILHPEKYLPREEPVVVELPDLAETLGGDWIEISQNTFGGVAAVCLS